MKLFTYNFLIIFIIISCNKNIDDSTNSNINEPWPFKVYEFDNEGNIIFSEIDILDFSPSRECASCHPQQYQEWKLSSHYKSTNNPIFKIQKNKAKEHFNNKGDRFCIQCHSPSLLISGLYDTDTLELSDDINEIINDGIGCDFCHSTTRLNTASLILDDYNLIDTDYYLNPGEGIKYGSNQNPQSNNFHDSKYNSIYQDSRFCLPCHNMVIRNVEAHMTMVEWASDPLNIMADNRNCQSCHMPFEGDHHNHMFSGIDVDLTKPLDHFENQIRIESIESLLDTAVISYFYNTESEIADTISNNDTLKIPFTIQNKTSHGIPSGTSYNREAWIELKVLDELNNVICEFGTIESNKDFLDYDENNIIFTSWVQNEIGDTIFSSIDIHSIIDNTLKINESVEWDYSCFIPDHISGSIKVSSRMRIRPVKPQLFYSDIEFNEYLYLLDNIPVFDINLSRIEKIIIID